MDVVEACLEETKLGGSLLYDYCVLDGTHGLWFRLCRLGDLLAGEGMAGGFHGDAEQAFAGGDVEGLAVLAGEGEIGRVLRVGELRRADDAERFAGGGEDLHAPAPPIPDLHFHRRRMMPAHPPPRTLHASLHLSSRGVVDSLESL